MKKNFIISAFLIAVLLGTQSCSVVGGIFKAGTAAGVILTIVIIALIIFLIARLFKKND